MLLIQQSLLIHSIRESIDMRYLLVMLMFCSVNAFAKPVNVNTASAKTISESLSGIGMKKAEAIVKYRTEKGPFKSASALTEVSGIGDKTVEKNRSDILVSDENVKAEKKAKKAK